MGIGLDTQSPFRPFTGLSKSRRVLESQIVGLLGRPASFQEAFLHCWNQGATWPVHHATCRENRSIFEDSQWRGPRGGFTASTVAPRRSYVDHVCAMQGGTGGSYPGHPSWRDSGRSSGSRAGCRTRGAAGAKQDSDDCHHGRGKRRDGGGPSGVHYGCEEFVGEKNSKKSPGVHRFCRDRPPKASQGFGVRRTSGVVDRSWVPTAGRLCDRSGGVRSACGRRHGSDLRPTADPDCQTGFVGDIKRGACSTKSNYRPSSGKAETKGNCCSYYYTRRGRRARRDQSSHAISAEGKTNRASRRTRSANYGCGSGGSDQRFGGSWLDSFDGRHVQAVDDQVAERPSSGQKEEETQKATWVGQLRGGQLQQRGDCRMDYVFKRRKRNRGSRKAAGGHDSESRGLSKSDGKQDDAGGGSDRDGWHSSWQIHSDSPSWKVKDGRLCFSRLCRDPTAHGGEQTSPGEVAHAEDDGGDGAVLDRRELDCGKPAHWRRRTTMGVMEYPGPRRFKAPIRLHQAGGVDLVGCHDQRVERGGMVDEKESQSSRRKRQSKRWEERSESWPKSRVRRRKPRFLRFQLSSKHDASAVEEEANQAKTLLAWLESMVEDMQNSNLPVARYVCSTMKIVDALQASEKQSELFPCAPPFPWKLTTVVFSRRSRRREARFVARRSLEIWTNLVICALSHQALSVEVAPRRGRCGMLLSAAQDEMVAFVKVLVSSVVRLGPHGSGSGLRLPAAEERLRFLREQLTEVSHLPYARQQRKFEEGGQDESFAATKALPVKADRLSLPAEVNDFHPEMFLSKEFLAIYEDPDLLLKRPEDMPAPMRVRGTASREELLKVFGRWDRLNRLFVCKPAEVNQLDRCELFAVAKDEEKDRQILHRKRRNYREYHLQGASAELPHGVLLTQLPLEHDKVCVCSVDDVKDFYHAYVATEQRARSSPVGPIFRWEEVAHLKSTQSAIAAGRLKKGDDVCCCFQGLGMGDHSAVDIAQESHVNLLRTFGGLVPEETMSYKRPLPSPDSGYYDGVMIDDHLGVQLLAWQGSLAETLQQPGRDEQAFRQAKRAYDTVGLIAHPGKQTRRSLHVNVWGAEVEGLQGLVGPSRKRLCKLAMLSAEASKTGAVDSKILEALTGLWAYAAQFRRPVFAFMYDIYHQQHSGSPSEPFKLTRGARNELLVLACVSPLCISDCRACPDQFLYCVDASPSGAGVCRARVGKETIRELWRRGDKLGYRAPMLSRLQSCLKGSGWDEDEVRSVAFDDEKESPESGERRRGEVSDENSHYFGKVAESFWEVVPPKLSEGDFDLLEMYAGCAAMSKSWVKKGLRVLPPLEVKDGWDLRDPKVFWGVVKLVKSGRVRFLWWAPPCTTFSLAKTPKIRDLEEPWGYDLMNPESLFGNLHACQAILLGAVQVQVGNWMAGEQPAFGFMRALDVWKMLCQHPLVFQILFDWCRFGRWFKKTTRLISNWEPLKRLAKRCCHSFRHPKLEGQATTLAGQYSQQFCDRVAKLWVRFVEDGHVFKDDSPPFEAPRKQKSGSPLWAVQLSEGLKWEPWLRYTFRMVVHINLQESKARRSLIKRVKRDQRVVVAQDSRVNLGAVGKGRSASKSLNALLRSEAPWVLGKNLYLSCIHFPTWSIRADAPSRNMPIGDPRVQLPFRFWALKQGGKLSDDVWDAMEGQPRSLNRWLLLGGAMLLKASLLGPSTSQSSSPKPRRFGKGEDPGGNPSISSGFAGQVRRVVECPSSWQFLERTSKASHSNFARLARRIYFDAVSTKLQSTGSSGDAKRDFTQVWLAEALSCKSLERHKNVGSAGTYGSSSTNSSSSSSCVCQLCSGLELVADVGDFGRGLFWITETIRIHLFATAGSFSALGSLGKRRDVSQSGQTKDKVSSGSSSACASGRAEHSSMGRSDAEIRADVETHLARFIGVIQDQVWLHPESSFDFYSIPSFIIASGGSNVSFSTVERESSQITVAWALALLQDAWDLCTGIGSCWGLD